MEFASELTPAEIWELLERGAYHWDSREERLAHWDDYGFFYERLMWHPMRKAPRSDPGR